MTWRLSENSLIWMHRHTEWLHNSWAPSRSCKVPWFKDTGCQWDGATTKSPLYQSPTMSVLFCRRFQCWGIVNIVLLVSPKPMSKSEVPIHTPPEWAILQFSRPEKWYTTCCQGPLGVPKNAFGQIWELNFQEKITFYGFVEKYQTKPCSWHNIWIWG